MPETDFFQIFLSQLEVLGFQYMVTGAVASIIYGEPRLTHDIDLILEMKVSDAQRIVNAFPTDQFYCPPIEILEQEARRSLRGHFNLIHHASGFKADIYLKGKDKLHTWAMVRRKQVELYGLQIWVAPPEYVILRKLEYYREGKSDKHLNDIAGMTEISKEQIDFKELEKWIRNLGLGKEWEEAKRYA